MKSESPRRGSPRLRRLLRELHHQTWELELLISGLVAFALIQLPEPMDQAQRLLIPQLGEGARLVGILVSAYLKIAVYMLIAGFVIHLVVRAFWVGLIGLDSVFPRGVRPERTRQGPVGREIIRETVPPVRRLIVQTDALASVLFAGTFSLVVVCVMVIPPFGLILAGGYGVAWLLPGEASAGQVFWWVWAVFLILAMVPPLLDRTVASRLDPGGRPRRFLKAVLSATYRATGFRVYGPIQLTLAGHLGERRVGIFTFLAILVVGTVYLANDALLVQGRVEMVGSPFLPHQAGEAFLAADHYDDVRDPRRGRITLPSIPSQVETGPFLRLFVPYLSGTADPLLRETCPDAAPVGRAGPRLLPNPRPDSATAARARAAGEALACAAELWEVTLDGAPVEVEPLFARHPGSGLHGLQYMLPTQALQEGRHTLRVTGPGDDPEAGARRYEIVFWYGEDH